MIEADITTPAPTAVGTGSGLRAEFWNNTSFSGTPAVTRTDPTVNYAWRFSGSPAPSIGTDNFAGRWTGSIEPRHSERCTFTAVFDDTVRLWIDGQLVIDNTAPHGPTVDQGSVTLTAGRHDLRLEHTEQGGEAYLKLIWSSPNTPAQVVPQAQLHPAAGTVRRWNDDVATYSSGWSVSSGRGLGDYNDDVHYTTTNGGSFTYAFNGTGVDYLSERYSDQGLADIYLDGVLKATVDTTNGTRLTQQVVYSVRGLSPGSHTLRGAKRSGTYLLVDRFDVVP
ncbi:PA14 domain-containing protein [Asanoa sp. NPDC049518]|uniref:PA14 domain-containing protein n=1 Tax=unclassified Asanoa TaxID=2685164 RepID=UPI00343E179C